MLQAIQAIVSLSPPAYIAVLKTSSKSFPSKNACIAIGTVTWQVSSKVCHFLTEEIGSKLYPNLSSIYFFISSLVFFFLAKYIGYLSNSVDKKV